MPPPAASPAAVKLEELFLTWLTLPDTQNLVTGLLRDIREHKPLPPPPPSPPPLSPRRRRRNSGGSASSSSTSLPVRHFTFDVPTSPRASPSRSRSAPAYAAFPIVDRSKDGEGGKDEADGPLLSLPTAAEEAGGRKPAKGGPPSAEEEAGSSRVADVMASSTSSASLPPLSPRSSSGASSSALLSKGLKTIPRFFIAGEGGRGRGRRIASDSYEARRSEVEERWAAFDGDGPNRNQFRTIAEQLCRYPGCVARPLFDRILSQFGSGASESKAAAASEGKKKDGDDDDAAPSVRLPLAVFRAWWLAEFAPYDEVDRLFRLLKSPERAYIFPNDLKPMMLEILALHPGLEFLEATPEFQERYALTVITRIFYEVNSSWTGAISARELRRSDLLSAMHLLDEEDDINAVLRFFSYEHFYVIYCKFWELDNDHDFRISKEDLLRYDNHALTGKIVERVFEASPCPFRVPDKDKMGYQAFSYFLLAEEDKSTQRSLDFWFRVCDLDCNGIIGPLEMRHFYAEQAHRMECLGHEVVPFEDMVCQMMDLIHPTVDGKLRLSDFLTERQRMVGVFFSALFNLNKFIAFEQRDPFYMKQQMQSEVTPWERFAGEEYARLAMEDDSDDETDGDLIMDDDVDTWMVDDDEEDIEIK
eukprot:PLAT14261.1.p1 GENE.PLAT14261.1~~PLAT14261.1.p1  ORF type:complete len:646 (+),score=297.02 PLAT14261.1:29-1966(+)